MRLISRLVECPFWFPGADDIIFNSLWTPSLSLYLLMRVGERRQKQSVFSVSRVLCGNVLRRTNDPNGTRLAYWRIKESYQIIWRKLAKEGRKKLYGKEDEEEQKQIRNTARDILWDKIERGEPLSRGDSRCTSFAGVKPNLVSAALILFSYSLSLCEGGGRG